MCIICIKEKGIQFPSVETVRTMCENNNDGFSLVVSNPLGKPSIYKTLNQSKFIELYRKVLRDYDYRDTSMFIHTRIATHGTLKISNCHGWKSDGLIFAHNGILSVKNRNDMTDSETYFRDIFIPAYRLGGWQYGLLTIQAIIGTSKFVFMDDNGTIHHFGDYIQDLGGLLFSNTSYKSIRWAYPTYRTHSWYQPQTGSCLYDDREEDIDLI